ncbi:MAG: M28 family peptidase [Planctomycetes bacterium]|nr:M28 family peptidase [Planctomycetota bacterium]
MIRMPQASYSGPLPPLSEQEITLREALRRDVQKLAGEIGERHVFEYQHLAAAADFIETSLAAAGFEVRRQGYEVEALDRRSGKEERRMCHNLEVEIKGKDRPAEIVIVGAHYDSVAGWPGGWYTEDTPGANDNASGTAALLALARSFSAKSTSRTLRFVAFVNEEPPHFRKDTMGSLVYARRCRQRGENVVAMLSLETIGYYSETKGSQKYPFPFGLFYPSTGNFIAFSGNVASRHLVRQAVGSFRRHADFPSEGGAVPEIFRDAGRSDHWAFWQQGYPALMVTDTADFRYLDYHEPDDTPDKIDYDRMARVVAGLERVIAELAD